MGLLNYYLLVKFQVFKNEREIVFIIRLDATFLVFRNDEIFYRLGEYCESNENHLTDQYLTTGYFANSRVKLVWTDVWNWISEFQTRQFYKQFKLENSEQKCNTFLLMLHMYWPSIYLYQNRINWITHLYTVVSCLQLFPQITSEGEGK